MATLGEISAAINLIEEKKQNLRKSFENLQSQSPSPFNFTLKWTDFDSYFTTVRSSLQHRFHLIQTLYPSSDTTSALAGPQFKSFCQNSDGLGLRRFIIASPDRTSIAAELPDAYRCAPDAAAMVLDAMEGFYRGNAAGYRGTDLHLVKSSCVTMLEGLTRLKPEVTVELREKAMKVAVQWKKEAMSSHFKEKEQNILGFLLLVGAYGLTDRFSMDEIIDCFLLVARRRQTIDLCPTMLSDDKINDLIQKLINKDMKIAAAKYSIEFKKTKEFPPVGLLEEHRLMAKRIAEEMRKTCKNLRAFNEAAMKEINALRSIIKCIDDYDLESEYPKGTLVAEAEKLENEIENRKRAARVPPAPKNQQPKKPKLNNLVEAVSTTTTQSVIPLQQPQLQAADHVAEYHGSATGSTPTPNAPYAGLTASPYGFTGANIGYGGNSMPGGSSFPHSRYDGNSMLGGSGLPPLGYGSNTMPGGSSLPPSSYGGNTMPGGPSFPLSGYGGNMMPGGSSFPPAGYYNRQPLNSNGGYGYELPPSYPYYPQ